MSYRELYQLTIGMQNPTLLLNLTAQYFVMYTAASEIFHLQVYVNCSFTEIAVARNCIRGHSGVECKVADIYLIDRYFMSITEEAVLL